MRTLQSGGLGRAAGVYGKIVVTVTDFGFGLVEKTVRGSKAGGACNVHTPHQVIKFLLEFWERSQSSNPPGLPKPIL